MHRLWFRTLSLLAAAAVIILGIILWQAVELDSLTTVSEQVDNWVPILGGLRLALIGLLAAAWHWIPVLVTRANDPLSPAHWMALRWRVIGWLLALELVIGQNLFGHIVAAIAL